jgi:hypothetical protein
MQFDAESSLADGFLFEVEPADTWDVLLICSRYVLSGPYDITV